MQGFQLLIPGGLALSVLSVLSVLSDVSVMSVLSVLPVLSVLSVLSVLPCPSCLPCLSCPILGLGGVAWASLLGLGGVAWAPLLGATGMGHHCMEWGQWFERLDVGGKKNSNITAGCGFWDSVAWRGVGAAPGSHWHGASLHGVGAVV